jgi:hypothetical protein
MGFSLRMIAENIRFEQAVTLNALERAVPQDEVEAVIEDLGMQEKRVRKLPAFMTLLLCIGMGLYTNIGLESVLNKMVKGLRYIWPGDEDYQTAGRSAISQARYRLGAKPVVELFHRICKPMTTENTPGAFLFGLRLMSIDGIIEDVPDTPANAAYFGRHHSNRGDGAFPQMQAVYLCESGSHAICDAGFWPCHTSERMGGLRMLRSVGEGMLVMWDRGFHSFDMAIRTLERKAHFLSRLPSHVKPEFVEALDDGSYLAWIYPSEYQRKKRGERLLVRVIEYTIDDPNRPGHGEIHRLVTSLLDPDLYPAHTLACEYHQRWPVDRSLCHTLHHARRCRTAPPRPRQVELCQCRADHQRRGLRIPDDNTGTGGTIVSASTRRYCTSPLTRARGSFQSARGQTQNVKVQIEAGGTPPLATADQVISGGCRPP